MLLMEKDTMEIDMMELNENEIDEIIFFCLPKCCQGLKDAISEEELISNWENGINQDEVDQFKQDWEISQNVMAKEIKSF